MEQLANALGWVYKENYPPQLTTKFVVGLGIVGIHTESDLDRGQVEIVYEIFWRSRILL
jgi:hypothetical protein